MRDTMRDLDGAGLAAPQIGVGLRVVIFGVRGQCALSGGAEPVPFTVLINPQLTPLGEETEEGWEGLPVGARHARVGAPVSPSALHRPSTPPASPSIAP